MRRTWTGCGTALVTPFTRDGAVDEAAVRRLARRQVDGGVHFLVPCGTTGESPTLTEDERVRIVELIVEEAAGTGRAVMVNRTNNEQGYEIRMYGDSSRRIVDIDGLQLVASRHAAWRDWLDDEDDFEEELEGLT